MIWLKYVLAPNSEKIVSEFYHQIISKATKLYSQDTPLERTLKSNLISKSDTAALLKNISEKWKMEFPKIKNLRVHQISDDAQIVTGPEVKILKLDQEYLPFLSETSILEKFPNVTVDMRAIKFMCNGANVMRPGIKNHTEFEKDSLVCVIEESQHKFLAVGKALVSSEELISMEKGEVIKNMHYISDRFWEIGKTIHC